MTHTLCVGPPGRKRNFLSAADGSIAAISGDTPGNPYRRMPRAIRVGCLLALCSVCLPGLAACGAASSANPSPPRITSQAIRVPDVAGWRARSAEKALSDRGFKATFETADFDRISERDLDEAAQANDCTVQDASPAGPAKPRAHVRLRLDCFKVPDTTGKDGASARDEIERNADVNVIFKPEPSSDGSDCTVYDQNVKGVIPQFADVTLSLGCPSGGY